MLALYIQIVILAAKKRANGVMFGGYFAGSRQTHAFSRFLSPVSLVILQNFYCSKRAESAKKAPRKIF